jgi:hypothetical protein
LRRTAAVLGLVLSLAGCGAPEQPLLERFFAASRLRDKVALQAFSTVIFEPRQQGIVRRFTITRVTPERTSGGAVIKDVTVIAPVVGADGGTAEHTLVVTLQRADASRTGYPWIVAAVRDATVSRSAPHW